MPGSDASELPEVPTFSSDPTQATDLWMHEEGDTLAAEDLELRRRGWPQRMIYRVRTAGYDAGAIRGLPVPSYDEFGFVNEGYWQELVNLNVPRTALDFMFPSIRSAGGTTTRTANGSGADTGFDDVRAHARPLPQ